MSKPETKTDCPILGTIARKRCLFEQRRAFENCVNHVHVRLFRACRACEHFLLPETAPAPRRRKGGKR